ncbi:MAG: type II toxin-antitoxin system Phd/YefM family antitoxin [bacterium]|nr:type II toxin-antitoxin system Phd/YefM family antitoxin [bacterium]
MLFSPVGKSDGYSRPPEGHEKTATTRECRDNFFAILKDVHETGVQMVLTKRGKPYVRIIRETDFCEDMFGCDKEILQIMGDIDQPLWSDEDFNMIARPGQVLG